MSVSKQGRVVNLILIRCNIYLRNIREYICIMRIYKIEQKRPEHSRFANNES